MALTLLRVVGWLANGVESGCAGESAAVTAVKLPAVTKMSSTRRMGSPLVMTVQTTTARCDSTFHSKLPVSDFFAGNLSAYASGQRGKFDAQVHLSIVKMSSFSAKKSLLRFK